MHRIIAMHCPSTHYSRHIPDILASNNYVMNSLSVAQFKRVRVRFSETSFPPFVEASILSTGKQTMRKRVDRKLKAGVKEKKTWTTVEPITAAVRLGDHWLFAEPGNRLRPTMTKSRPKEGHNGKANDGLYFFYSQNTRNSLKKILLLMVNLSRPLLYFNFVIRLSLFEFVVRLSLRLTTR